MSDLEPPLMFHPADCAPRRAFRALNQSREEREWERFPVPAPIDLDLTSGTRKFRGRVANISMGGALVQLGDPVTLLPHALEKQGLIVHVDGWAPIGARAVWNTGTALGIKLDYNDASLDLVALCLRGALGAQWTEKHT